MTPSTLPSGWHILPLIDVATLQRGFDLPVQDRVHGPIPVFAANGPVGTHAVAMCKGPGVVTGRSGTIGKVHYVPTDYWPLNTSLFVKDFHGNHPRFIFHLLSQLGLERFHEGTGVPTLNRNNVHTAKVVVPPLPEQRRIADILDRAESLRAKRRAALAKLDTLTQAIFLEMFGDIRQVHSRWPVKPLGDLLDFMTSGSRGWAEHYANSGAIFLRIQNVCRDELKLEDVAFVNAPETAEARRTRVQSGDVLLSVTADLGRTAVVPDGIGAAYINQHLTILRTTALVPRFLSAYLTSPAGQLEVHGRNRHGVKAGLNFDDVRSFRIPVPPQSLQHEFVRRVGVVEELKSSHRASLAQLDALFASLQHRAFRGEL